MHDFKHKCELKLLVCEPNPLRPDRVTVGFVLRDQNPEDPRVEVRFSSNLSAVKCIYPNADLEAIEGTLFEMESVLKNVTDFENYLHHLPADFPADFQLLSGGALLTDDLANELILLETQYLGKLEPPQGEKSKSTDPIGRPYLKRKMHEAFNQLGVSGFLITDMPVHDYTFQGDRLKMDFMYRTESKSRIMHAASVVIGVGETAKLAASWPAIRKGMGAASGICELVAVIEDSRFNQSEQARAAQWWMTNAGIEIRPVSDIMLLAEEVKRDLKL